MSRIDKSKTPMDRALEEGDIYSRSMTATREIGTACALVGGGSPSYLDCFVSAYIRKTVDMRYEKIKELADYCLKNGHNSQNTAYIWNDGENYVYTPPLEKQVSAYHEHQKQPAILVMEDQTLSFVFYIYEEFFYSRSGLAIFAARTYDLKTMGGSKQIKTLKQILKVLQIGDNIGINQDLSDELLYNANELTRISRFRVPYLMMAFEQFSFHHNNVFPDDNER